MARQRWINIQAALVQRMPHAMAVFAGNMRHLPSYLRWWFHPKGRSQAQRLLASLKDRYRGCRCVVIGNGPSLKRMDLAPLQYEFTFGLNRIYLLFDEWGFETNFLVAVNRFVIQQFGEEMKQCSSLKILNWSYYRKEIDGSNACFLETRPVLEPDGNLLSGYYAGGGTVTNVALQAAFFLGFSEVIVIGVDHNYEEQGLPNQAVRSRSEDKSHFSEDYFGPGVVWQLPDLEAMERGYSQVKRLFEQDDRRLVDATVDGKLDVFPKANFAETLAQNRFKNQLDFEANRRS